MSTWLDPRVPELGRELGLALLLAALGIALALLVHRLLYGLLKRLALASESKVDDVVVRALRAPTRYAMAALGFALAADEAPLLGAVWDRLVGFVMPALIGWIALAGLNAFVQAMTIGAEAAPAGSKSVRRRRTRLAIFARIGAFLIVFLTVGLMLLSIPGVRDVGLTLMASAGLAGLAVGAAAQPALRSLIAGLQ
ncbi:MAG TPA: mechanosensitive ion channel family protein, partial [Croceibacterium sp.]|nr:mechanosensitive ion channel family protein [Croceibacterium sp.]